MQEIIDPNELKFNNQDILESISNIVSFFAPTIKAIVFFFPTASENKLQLVGFYDNYTKIFDKYKFKFDSTEIIEKIEGDLILNIYVVKDSRNKFIGKIGIIYKSDDKNLLQLKLYLNILYKSYYRNLGFNTLQKINSYILGIFDKWQLLQKIVDTVTIIGDYKVGYITLVKDNKVYARTVSRNLLGVKIVLKMLGRAFYKFYANLDKDDTKTIRAIKENKIYIGDKFYEFVSPPAPKATAIIGEKLVGVSQHIAIPICSVNGVVGTLNIASDKEFNNNEIIQLKNYADQISIAISITNLLSLKENQLQLLVQKNAELQTLYNLTSQVTRTLDPVKVSQTAVNSLPQNEIMLGGMILSYDEKTKTVAFSATSQNQFSFQVQKVIGDFSKFKQDISDPKFINNPVVKALDTGLPQSADGLNILSPPIPAKLMPAIEKIINIKSLAIYPLHDHGKISGVIIYFLKNTNFTELEDGQKQLLQTYTYQIAIALENAKLYKALQEALAQLQEARRQERDMIDVMGHELRTPITIVRNALLILAQQYKFKKEVPLDIFEKYMEMAIESTRREMTLIETLLAATKIDARRIQFNKEKVNMLDVIDDAIEGQKHFADDRKIKINYEKPNQEFIAYADRVRTQEIVDNLLNNAVKYTQKGYVEIKIEKLNKEMLRVSIKDTGIGISKEDMQNLGKKFFRAKQYINTQSGEAVVRPGGTGLGLYVVFGLVKAMGGEINIESKLGKGSTFSFTLPIYTGQKIIINDSTQKRKVSVLKI
mgnify:CR=1 FL=1